MNIFNLFFTIIGLLIFNSLSFAKETTFSCDLTKPVIQNTAYGPVTLSLCEKSEPEPALAPYWLKAKVQCKNGKTSEYFYSICDSDLGTQENNGILYVNYVIGDFKKTEKSHGEQIHCQKKILQQKIELKKICSKVK